MSSDLPSIESPRSDGGDGNDAGTRGSSIPNLPPVSTSRPGTGNKDGAHNGGSAVHFEEGTKGGSGGTDMGGADQDTYYDDKNLDSFFEERADMINPFNLPNEDVFLMRERERVTKLQHRENQKNLPIWEKGVGKSTRLAVSQIRNAQKKGRGSLIQKQERLFQGRRRDKENMTDFIAKKREMFLIQMSLDTKRQEIQKLEEKAKMKEEALQKAEQMLDEDALRFDQFLKDNDRKAHLALKRADQETKEKQAKVLEIKKLKQEIQKVDGEKQKYKDQLKACLKYKKFIDKRTPKEHLDIVRQMREDRRRKRYEASGKPMRPSKDRKGGDGEGKPDDEGLDSDDDDDSEDDDEVEPMYFTRSEQLLDIFAQLEERNLQLIQSGQEAEDGLEDLNQKYEETKRQMTEKTDKLQTDIDDLERKIKAEKEKADALRKRDHANALAGNQQQLLKQVSDQVQKVYVLHCSSESQADTLDMLRDLETHLESLLNDISKLPPALVAEAEKKNNENRRDKMRQAIRDEQKRQYEERLANSMKRATAEVVKRNSKQVMYRSAAVTKKKKKEVKIEKDDDEEEYIKFFT